MNYSIPNYVYDRTIAVNSPYVEYLTILMTFIILMIGGVSAYARFGLKNPHIRNRIPQNDPGEPQTVLTV